MRKRGSKPRRKVRIRWSSDFAYAIGLIVTDGNLSLDGRHITFVSKDIEQITNFLKCLNIEIKIGETISGYDGNISHRVQFGDVIFYKYLQSIGLSPAKSKIIGELNIPEKYFFDFLRGHFDGDGTFYSYWDPRWKSSHMFYVEFVSASLKHIEWLRRILKQKVNITGHTTKNKRKSAYQLKYAKGESWKLLRKMYYNKSVVCLSRKRVKVERALRIEEKQQIKYATIRTARVL